MLSTVANGRKVPLISKLELDAVAFHRNLSASVTTPLLLVLLLPKTGTPCHDQIGVCLGPIVIGRSSSRFKSVIFEPLVCELDLINLNPLRMGP